MSTDKLSELKAAAEKSLELGGIKNYKKGDAAIAAFKAAATPAAILALLAELEAKDKRIAELSRLLAHNIDRAEKAEKRLVYSKDAISTWERKAISNFDECATMSQRIIELEAIRSDASQVFKEIGNELGCNPDNESIMMAIDELKKRLATPVRLPNKNDDEFWFDSVFQVAKFDRAVERAISSAGFKFVGDE